MDDFFQYLYKQEKLSLGTIQYIQKKYGEELSNKAINRILKILEVSNEIGIDRKYLNQYHNIFDMIDVYDDDAFNEAVDFIRSYSKKKKKKKNPYILIFLMISSNEIIKNKKQEDSEKILELLEREGLLSILEDKSQKAKGLLYKKDYDSIVKNLNILKQEKGYKSLIRSNPTVLFNSESNELQKVVDDIKSKREQDKLEQKELDKEETETITLSTDNEELEEDIEQQEKDVENEDIEQQENDIENEDIEQEDDDNILEEEANDEQNKEETSVKLGKEDKVLHVLEVLKMYGVPYNILIICPDILKRKKLYEIDNILELLKQEDIPLSILEFCPEILEKGKSKDIFEVIRGLKLSNLSLTMITVCPSILINTTPGKIQKVIETLEKNHVSRYLIYSTPQILISGKTDILIEVGNEIKQSAPDINLILTAMLDPKEKNKEVTVPYVFIESAYNYSNILTENEHTETVNRKAISTNQEIVIIKHADETQKVIDVLKKEKVDLSVIREEPHVLNTPAGSIKEVVQKIKEEDLDKKLVEKDPKILVKGISTDIEEIVETLQENRPMSYKSIITTLPAVLYESSTEKIETAVANCQEHKLDYTFIDKAPQLLTVPDSEEPCHVAQKLKEHGYTSEQIKEKPELIIRGKTKYIDRNFETFERNRLNIPLHLVHVSSARNNEKNIDTLIENGLYQHIEQTPEVLMVKHSKLLQYISIAKKNDIPLVIQEKSDTPKKEEQVTEQVPAKKKKQGRINMAYLELQEQELSDIYGIDMQYIESERRKAEKKDTQIRRIDESQYKQYRAIYPIVERQAEVVLEPFAVGEVAYSKNGKIISKQKVIRETSLDLVEIVSTGGKGELKKHDSSKMLSDKVEELTTEKKKTTFQPMRATVMRRRPKTYGIMEKTGEIRQQDKTNAPAPQPKKAQKRPVNRTPQPKKDNKVVKTKTIEKE